jgi:hypothetical protein
VSWALRTSLAARLPRYLPALSSTAATPRASAAHPPPAPPHSERSTLFRSAIKHAKHATAAQDVAPDDTRSPRSPRGTAQDVEAVNASARCCQRAPPPNRPSPHLLAPQVPISHNDCTRKALTQRPRLAFSSFTLQREEGRRGTLISRELALATRDSARLDLAMPTEEGPKEAADAAALQGNGGC